MDLRYSTLIPWCMATCNIMIVKELGYIRRNIRKKYLKKERRHIHLGDLQPSTEVLLLSTSKHKACRTSSKKKRSASHSDLKHRQCRGPASVLSQNTPCFLRPMTAQRAVSGSDETLSQHPLLF